MSIMGFTPCVSSFCPLDSAVESADGAGRPDIIKVANLQQVQVCCFQRDEIWQRIPPV